MSGDYLTIDIIYPLEGKFELKGDVNREGQIEIIDGFLRNQIGKGEDKKQSNKQDIYHISLKWFPRDDTIQVSDDTGNKGLRDGILMDVLNKIQV